MPDPNPTLESTLLQKAQSIGPDPNSISQKPSLGMMPLPPGDFLSQLIEYGGQPVRDTSAMGQVGKGIENLMNDHGPDWVKALTQRMAQQARSIPTVESIIGQSNPSAIGAANKLIELGKWRAARGGINLAKRGYQWATGSPVPSPTEAIQKLVGLVPPDPNAPRVK